MRYLPKSPADRAEMLANIGVASIDDLFSTIPVEYRLTSDLKVPRQHGESEIIAHFKGAAAQNARGMPASWGREFIATTGRSSSIRWCSAGSFSRPIRPIRRRSRKGPCRRSSSFRP